MSAPQLYIKVLDEGLYAEELRSGFHGKYPGDAGIDLRSTEDIEVAKGTTIKVSLGVAVAVPYGFVGWLGGRSSTAISWDVVSHEGKIDAGYRGPVHGILTAVGRNVQITRGERIAQLVIVPIVQPIWEIATDQEWSDLELISHRGKLGLGSTGRA